jgi:hypothetical protein
VYAIVSLADIASFGILSLFDLHSVMPVMHASRQMLALMGIPGILLKKKKRKGLGVG